MCANEHDTTDSERQTTTQNDDADVDVLVVVDGQVLAAGRVGDTRIAIAQPVDADPSLAALSYVVREATMIGRAEADVDQPDGLEVAHAVDRPGEAGGSAATPASYGANGGGAGGD